MWHDVRRELARLEWEVEPPLTLDLLSEWQETLASLLAVRRALGPISDQSPLALLATATKGAAAAGADANPILAPSLEGVRGALADVAQAVRDEPPSARSRHAAALTHIAYELTHWVRVRARDDAVRQWMSAGETILDGAVHAPAPRSATGAALAAWHEALAVVQPVHNMSIVQRSVALGHLTILEATHDLVQDAQRAAALPSAYAAPLLATIRDVARAHQAALASVDGLPLGSSRADQAVRQRLGMAVRHLNGRPDPNETSATRLDAFLRTGAGQSALVAGITADAGAQAAAATLHRLTLQYLAHPQMLRRGDWIEEASVPAPPTRSVREAPVAPRPKSPAQPSIEPGTMLDGDAVVSLCRARDLGAAAAAAVADPANPPEILRAIDPSRWPQLVEAGQQAVTDLVTSVVPMAYAVSRNTANSDDVRGHMFVRLMRAATIFDPQQINPDRWPAYAWTTLQRARWLGVDRAGVEQSRQGAKPVPLSLGDVEPPSRDQGPDALVAEKFAIEAITDAVQQLPPTLRVPLVLSMEGRTPVAIAEQLDVSVSTVRRRITRARENVEAQLTGHWDASDDGPFETIATDPVLERSQRFEQSRAPSPVQERGRPAR